MQEWRRGLHLRHRRSSSTLRRRSLVQLDSEDEALADDEEAIFGGTTEQHCKCRNGVVDWSASGACSFGTGKPTAKKSVKSQADCAKEHGAQGQPGLRQCLHLRHRRSSSTSRRRSLVQLDSEDGALADEEEQSCKARVGTWIGLRPARALSAPASPQPRRV